MLSHRESSAATAPDAIAGGYDVRRHRQASTTATADASARPRRDSAHVVHTPSPHPPRAVHMAVTVAVRGRRNVACAREMLARLARLRAKVVRRLGFEPRTRG